MSTLIVAMKDAAVARGMCRALSIADVATCYPCTTGNQAREAVRTYAAQAVLASFMLGDGPAQELYDDLPQDVPMLMVARPAEIETLSDGIIALEAPVTGEELVCAVRVLLQAADLLSQAVRPRRSSADKELVQRAKQFLMDSQGMSEEDAYRFLQKTSMNSGVSMARTAKIILGA
jgi:response regulator NasT